MDRLQQYIDWLESGNPIDKDECLNYLRDALADKKALVKASKELTAYRKLGTLRQFSIMKGQMKRLMTVISIFGEVFDEELREEKP